MHNSAFVIGSGGGAHPLRSTLGLGAICLRTNLHAMSFLVKGVPAVVTVGRDGLWSELSELAAGLARAFTCISTTTR
jgi:hypothetical protein